MSEYNTSDFVAIIGIGCRFPGALDKDAFWNNLRNGDDVLVEYTDEELLSNGVHPETVSAPEYVKCGYPIDDIEAFDAGFFRYSAAEALHMDPQQRLFLQCAWTALEDGGLASDNGSHTGVFACAKMSSYLDSMVDPNTNGTSAAFGVLIGNDKDYISTRTSFKFGLTGPSVTVQSACSSSLVAVHMAVQSLLSGECDAALAGGASITIPQRIGYLYEEGMICSPDGKCQAFDENARGICAGNGVGVVLLKPLDDALRDKNNIYAVIRGSAMNNDGSDKAGFTTPSVSGQSEVIRGALLLAGVSAREISYLEAHGTGTALGDPIEIQALTRAYRHFTQDCSYCAIASVKTNVGHLDTAAGICSLIKTCLALKHAEMPPSLHFSKPNPRIQFETTPFQPISELRPWDTPDGRRFAGVSSFGVGGSNVHMILEGPPAELTSRLNNGSEPKITDVGPVILPVSTQNEEVLRELCSSLADFLIKESSTSLTSMMRTLCQGRKHFPCRTAVVGASCRELAEKLVAPNIAETTGKPLCIGFMFTGQGCQHVGMGKKLYQSSKVFRLAVDKVAEAMQGHLDKPLIHVLFEKNKDLLENTKYSQPAIFAIEYGLCKYWLSLRVVPHAVIGHSIGEYAAACAADVMSIEDAAHLICRRGALCSLLPAGCGMTAFFAAPEEVVKLILDNSIKDVDVAAYNGPQHTVLAGPIDSLRSLECTAEEREIFFHSLAVSHAFHSRQLDPIIAEFKREVNAVHLNTPSINYISCLTGQKESKILTDILYWTDHLRRPVQFTQGVQALLDSGCNTIIEVGPHAVLEGMGKRFLGSETPILTSMQKGLDPRLSMAEAISELYRLGSEINWEPLLFQEEQMISLPTYPFRKDTYWSPRVISDHTSRETTNLDRKMIDSEALDHPLQLRCEKHPVPTFKATIDTQRITALQKHIINGKHMAPLGVLATLMTDAWKMFKEGDNAISLENIHFKVPVLLSHDIPASVHVLPEANGDIRIFQNNDGQWISCTSAKVVQRRPEPPQIVNLFMEGRKLSLNMFPAFLQGMGRDAQGNPLWHFENAQVSENVVQSDIVLEKELLHGGGGLDIHPSLIDPCIQLLGAFPSLFSSSCNLIPILAQSISFYNSHGERLRCSIRLTGGSPEIVRCDIVLQTPKNKNVLSISGLGLVRIPGELDPFFYETDQKPGLTHLYWRQIERIEDKGREKKNTRIFTAFHPHPSKALSLQFIGTHPVRIINASNINTNVLEQVEKDISSAKDYPNGQKVEFVYIAENSDIGDHVYFFSELSKFGKAHCFTLVTSGAVSVNGEKARPSQRVAWELARVFAAENLQTFVACIDLQDWTELEEALSLLLDQPHIIRQCAYRQGRLLCPVLKEIPKGEADTPSWENVLAVPEGKTALVSGATGGLGRALIKCLVQNGCRSLLLTARNEPKSIIKKEWDELLEHGVLIHFHAADISNRENVIDLLQYCGDKIPKLGSVYHLAGESSHAPLAKLSPDEFLRRTAAKIKGADLLHEITAPMEPDIFVMFSSISTLHGVANAGAYSASNGYLEALSEMRKSQGLPSICIAWGPFNDCGMLKDDLQGHEQRKSLGIFALNVDTALGLLEAIPVSLPVVLATANDWSLFHEKMSTTGNELWFSLSDKIIKGKDEGRNNQPSEMITPPLIHKVSKDGNLERFLREAVVELLKSSKPPLPEENLLMSGLDSLLFLQLAQKLRKTFGVKLSPSEVFSNPTMKNICDLVRRKIRDTDENKPQPTTADEQQSQSFELTDTQYAYWAGRSNSLPLGNVSCHSYAEYDVENLIRARYSTSWDALIQRHPMLRMVITADGRQRTLPTIPPLNIKYYDLRELPEAVQNKKMSVIRNELSHKIHETSDWPLFTVQTVRLSDTVTRICISLDLLLADARSLQIIMRELRDIYEATKENQSPEQLCSQDIFQDLEYTFEQYLADHKQWKDLEEGRQILKAASTYWDKRLQELSHGPDLPLAVAPKAISKPRFKQHRAVMLMEKWSVLKEKAQARGFTPSLLLMAVYAEVLARWSCSKDFCLNVTLFDRKPYHPQVNDIVGDFTSLSLLEINHDPTKPFLARISSISDQFWKDMEHSSLNGVQVIRQLTRMGRMSFGESYPVVFTSNISGGSAPHLLEAMGERGFNISQTPQVWLDNQVHEEQGELVIHWDAVDDLFHKSMIDDMLSAYIKILDSLAESDSAWLQNSFDILPQRTTKLIENMNKTETDLPKCTLFSLFQDACRKKPNAPSVITSDALWTYAKIACRAEAVAEWIEANDIAPGTPVGVSLPKGALQIAAVLGVCSSGAAFVPIDHELPQLRREALIEEAGLDIILTEDIVAGLKPSPDEENLLTRSPVQPGELAYIIYTSGSTGKPKGVEVSHEAAVNTLLDINRRYDIDGNDKIFGVSRLTFDLSVYDIFGAFAAGAALVLPNDMDQRDPAHWLDCLSVHQCTVWNSAPALLQLIVEYAESSRKQLPYLCTVMLSGDKISPDLPSRMKNIAPNAKIHSLGGATEAAIWSICFPSSDHKPSDGPIPYGRPLNNQHWYVLDESLEPRPEYVLGNLYIGGKGLALGYYKDKARTDKAFIYHPDTGQRLYCTGDLGAMSKNGILNIAGRRDFQVKINGHRVEPAEVEHMLSGHPEIISLSVSAIKTVSSTKIACYYTGSAQEEDLRDYASKLLPHYMVPSHFMRLKEFPVTSSGKIDRKALPQIVEDINKKPDSVEPLTTTEQKVATIWNSLLQRESTHPEMDFFSAGGDSVLAARITLELRKSFQTEFALPRFFESPTIRGLASYFHSQNTINDDLSASKESSDKRRPIKKAPENVVDILHTSMLAQHPLVNSIHSLIPYDMSQRDVPNPTKIKRPFITGVTGFVGSHLLDSLLARPIDKIFCLVRAQSKEIGLQRLLETASNYGLDFQNELQRIEIILGDLTEEWFGLTPDKFYQLADSTDAIFHAGALVHYIYSCDTLVGPNVRGVTEVVRLACIGQPKHIHHISTISVFSPIRSESSLKVYEEETIDQDMQVFGGYPQSKWIAEKILNLAAEHGVPINIYRLGLVTGSSRTGSWNKEDFLYRIVKGSIQAGCFPNLDRTENFLPVDVVSDAIVHIALNNTGKRFFHIDGFNPVRASTLFQAMHNAGAKLRLVSYDEWRKRIDASGNALFPLLPIFPREVDPDKISRQLVFDNSNTKESLKNSIVKFPKLDELLPLYLRTLMS